MPGRVARAAASPRYVNPLARLGSRKRAGVGSDHGRPISRSVAAQPWPFRKKRIHQRVE